MFRFGDDIVEIDDCSRIVQGRNTMDSSAELSVLSVSFGMRLEHVVVEVFVLVHDEFGSIQLSNDDKASAIAATADGTS